MGKQGLDARLPLRLVANLDMPGCNNGVDLTDKAHVAGIIGKGSNMHRCHFAQAPQYMMRPDFVAAISGPRDTVSKKQYLAHQPSPFAIQGPNRFAIGSGNFCQSAIFA